MIAKGVSYHAFKAYEFSHVLPNSYPSAILTHANKTSIIWHEIFVHLNIKYLRQLHNEDMVEVLSLIMSFEVVCNGCLVGKHPERRYEVGKERRVSSTLDLVHSVFSRSMPTTSMNGYRYFLTFIDDYSRYCWIYFLKQKFEVFETFKVFKALAEKTLVNNIKALRLNNGGDYKKREFQQFYTLEVFGCNIQSHTHHKKMV